MVTLCYHNTNKLLFIIYAMRQSLSLELSSLKQNLSPEKKTTHIKSPQHTLRVLGNRMPNFHRTRDVFQPFSQCFSTILQSFLFVLFLTHFNDFLQYFDDGRIPQASCQHETWMRLVARRPIRWLRSIRNVQI